MHECFGWSIWHVRRESKPGREPECFCYCALRTVNIELLAISWHPFKGPQILLEAIDSNVTSHPSSCKRNSIGLISCRILACLWEFSSTHSVSLQWLHVNLQPNINWELFLSALATLRAQRVTLKWWPTQEAARNLALKWTFKTWCIHKTWDYTH